MIVFGGVVSRGRAIRGMDFMGVRLLLDIYSMFEGINIFGWSYESTVSLFTQVSAASVCLFGFLSALTCKRSKLTLPLSILLLSGWVGVNISCYIEYNILHILWILALALSGYIVYWIASSARIT